VMLDFTRLCSSYLVPLLAWHCFACEFVCFFVNDPATTEIYTLSLHDALPIWGCQTMEDALRLTCLSCGQANRFSVTRLDAGPKCAKCGVLLVGGDVAAIDDQRHDKAIRSDGIPLIVDYWEHGCGPCRTMAPEFHERRPNAAWQNPFCQD